MMPSLPFQWHLLVFLISVGGFASLALAAEREGKLLLHRAPGSRARLALRFSGWALLALAFAICAVNWHPNFGTVLWFGWLTVAVTGLVFAIAYWPWRQHAAKQPTRKQTEASRARVDVPLSIAQRIWRGVLLLLLAGLPTAFGWQLYLGIATP